MTLLSHNPQVCTRCGHSVVNVRGTLWHVGDAFHQLHDHVPVVIRPES